MTTATKSEILALRGPEPLNETFNLPGTTLSIEIHGIVTSSRRAAIYREIDNMAGLRDVNVGGERVEVTEDDVIAACWAEACVTAPRLTAMEWLMVGAKDTDLLALIGARTLVCSRLMPDGAIPAGVDAARRELTEGIDPLATMPSASVSSGSEGCRGK